MVSKKIKPREKILSRGVETLSDSELIMVFLESGNRYYHVSKTARSFVKRLKPKLLDCSVEDLTDVPGVGKSKALSFVAIRELLFRYWKRKFLGGNTFIRTSEDAANYLNDLKYLKQEHLVALFLDTHLQLIDKRTITIGTIAENVVHPREIFAPAIELRAYKIILAHNHPSGFSVPSDADIKETIRLMKVGNILGIPIIDHIILSRQGWVSILDVLTEEREN